MDVIVALVLVVAGLIVASVIFYARRNDLVHLIRNPADALFFVHRNSPPKPDPRPRSETGDKPPRS